MSVITFKPGEKSWWCRHFGHKFGDWQSSIYDNSDFEITFRECLWYGGQEWKKESTEEIRREYDSGYPKPPAGFLDSTIIPGHKYAPLLKADPMLMPRKNRNHGR